MKCVDCGQEFQTEKTEKEVKVKFDNPGVILFNAKTSECPNCHQHYIDHEDMEEVCNLFEAECNKKEPSKKSGI